MIFLSVNLPFVLLVFLRFGSWQWIAGHETGYFSARFLHSYAYRYYYL